MSTPERLFSLELLKIPEKYIHAGNSVNVEVGGKCFTKCTACYMKDRAIPDGILLSLSKIKERIDFIAKHTDAEEISALGGEILLHPDFGEIIKYIWSVGLIPSIITSGVINLRNEQQVVNLNQLYEFYESGELQVQLSYHPDRNEKAYKKIINNLRELAVERRKNIEKKKGTDPRYELIAQKYSLSTTVTINREVASNDSKLKKVFEFILYTCNGYNSDTAVTDDGKPKGILGDFVTEQLPLVKKHFAPFGQSAHYTNSLTIGWGDGGIMDARFWGAIGVETQRIDGQVTTKIHRPMGNEKNAQACPAMSSQVRDNQLYADGLLIRSDGEMVFSQPSCIEWPEGFANIDLNPKPEQILKSYASRLGRIDKLIHHVDKVHESERPTTDTGCVSCPFDVACNMCHRMRNPKPGLIDPESL